MGMLADRIGYVKSLKIGTAMFVLAGLVLSFGITQTTFLLSTGISVLAWLIFGSASSAYVLASAGEESGSYMGIWDSSASAGSVVSIMLLPLLLSGSAFLMGSTIAGLIIISYIFLLKVPEEKHRHPRVVTGEKALYLRRHFFHKLFGAMGKLNPASWILALKNFAAATYYGTLWFVIPLIIESTGSKVLSFGLAIFDLSAVALGFLIGRMADSMNKKVLIFFGLLVFWISGAALSFHFGWLFVLLGFIASTGDEIAEISLWAWMHKLDKKHLDDGLVSGVIVLFSDLGWCIGPIMAGFALPRLGSSYAILLGAGLLFVLWITTTALTWSAKLEIPERTQGLIPRKPNSPRHKH